MGMMINRRRVMGKKLPYDAEIEYLESTGTQWIDTRIIPSNVSAMSVDIRGRQSNTDSALFGISANIYAFNTGVDANSLYYRLSSINGNVNTTLYTDVINIHISKIYGLVIDGVKYADLTNAGAGNANYSFVLFGRRDNTDGTVKKLGNHRIYLCSIKINNILTTDLIPVRVGQVGYLYDKVSKQLFGNAGTGAFILGPDKN